jgi:mRNA interferase RelE/StbE
VVYLWDIPGYLKDQIRHLPPDLKRQVWDALDFVQQKQESGKALSEELAGFRSYRIGKYRLIYRIEEKRLVLEALGPRENIYERLVLEIGRAKIRERSAKYATRPRKR